MEHHGNEADGRALLQHAVWLRRLAVALVGEQGAEDLAQETWHAALSSRVDSGRPLKPWLRRVATNFAARSFRRRERSDDDALATTRARGVVDPAELTERIDNETHLTEILRELEEPFRSTLYLRFYEDLEPKEIARRSDSPSGTVRWRLKRGLELMRERLDERVAGGRETWMAMLTPLAGLELKKTVAASTSALTSSSATPLLGVFGMSTTVKVLVFLIGGLALYAGLELTGQLPGAIPISGPDMLADSVEKPDNTARETTGNTELASGEGQQDSEERVAALVTGSRHVTPPTMSTRASLRVLDQYGAALEGAQVVSSSRKISELTNPDGLIELALGNVKSKYLSLLVSRQGHATILRRFTLQPNKDNDLGELRLEPGGSVSGRVQDENGKSLAGVTLNWMDGSTDARRLEGMRFNSIPTSTPSCRTGEDGRFLLEGLPVGRQRVWASLEQHTAQFSAPFDVEAGEETPGIEFTLPPLPLENQIEVLVVRPDGLPASGARLVFRQRVRSRGTAYNGTRFADDLGRSLFVMEEDALLTISAHDPEGSFGSVTLEDLKTDEDQVVLHLGQARKAPLTVTHADGAPCEEFTLEVRSANGEDLLERVSVKPSAEDEDPTGRVEFQVPVTAFLLRVVAPLAEIAELGPLEPGKVQELSLRLLALPGLSGVVREGEQVLAGARVSLHEILPEQIEYSVNGYRTLHRRDAVDETTSDQDGRFVLTIREAGRYVVRVEAAELSPADTALEIGSDLRGPDLEFVLGHGGVLEGEVRVPAGESPRDLIVGISRGDTYAQTARVDRDGRYRFEKLTPGPWRVALVDQLVRRESTSTSSRSGGEVRGYSSLEWDCEVLEDQTTFHVLEVEPQATIRFAGQLHLAGQSELSWNARLLPAGSALAPGSLSSAPVRADGFFELELAEEQPCQLVLRADSKAGVEYFLVDRANLQEPDAWRCDLTTGVVLLENLPPWNRLLEPDYVLLQELGEDRYLMIAFGGDEHGSATLDHAPVGTCKILKPDLRKRDPRTWSVVKEIEVSRDTPLRVSM